MTCVLVAVTGLACAALLTAAILAPAPAAALPVLVVMCIGCPLLSAWELPVAVTVLRVWRRTPPEDPGGHALDREDLSELCRRLDALPETEHPLGL